IDLNETQAAIRAGYSKKSAAQQGCALLKDPNVQKRVNELKHAREKTCAMSAMQVIEELARIASADIKTIVKLEKGDKDGWYWLSMADWDKVDGRLISEIVIEKETKNQPPRAKVKLWPKVAALET